MKNRYLQKKYRSTKAVSAVITTIILTGILLTILVVASFVSLNILSAQVASTEFEQAKANMQLLDDTVQDVSLRSGSGGYVQFNEQNGGIGISKTTETITIKANPGQTYLTTKPIVAGFYSQWTVFPNSVERAVAVSDDKDTTYLSSATLGQVETLKPGAVIPRASAIQFITLNVRVAGTKAQNDIQILGRYNNVDFHSPTKGVANNNFNVVTEKYTTNPVTHLAWEWSDLSKLEVGFNLTKYNTGSEVRVSEVYVIIDFTPPSSTTTIINQAIDAYKFEYSAGSQTGAAAMILRGTNDSIVSITEQLGFLRVEQDAGAKIKLDYNRVRIANQTLVDPYTNMIQITFVNLVKGDWGGSGSIHLKVQNTQVDSTPHVIPSGNVTLSVQIGSSGPYLMFFDKYAGDPNVLSTVIIFSEVTVEASTA